MNDAFRFIFGFFGFMFLVYMIGSATFLFLAVLVGSSALYDRKRSSRLKNELHSSYYVPVSILVPAYNESITVCDTIRSLLALDYKLYEIIVVDDGSRDDTSRVICDAFNLRPINRPIQRLIRCREEEAVYESEEHKVPITLIRKKNGGKADSLNMGINASRYPYFLCMDADSILQRDSLDKLVRPVLSDNNVVAVGGAVRPVNGAEIEDGRLVKYSMPKKILASMQVLEYERSFLAARILFDRFNGSLIISGAFGLFKKSTVVAAGGYDSTTVGEDMELVVRLHAFCRENRLPYKIRYATDAICWTQVPESLKDLRKQRRRWHIGLFQSMMRHRKILFNPLYGLVGLVTYMYFLIFELLSPYIEVFGVLITIAAYFMEYLNLPFMLLYSGIYIVYSSLMSLTAFFARIHTTDMKLSLRDAAKAIVLCAFEVSVLRFIMAWVRMMALVGYKKKKHAWEHLERKVIQYK